MSTALHDPPHGIRVGRLVKAAIKARVLKTPAPAAQPLAPKPQEVRVLLFLSFGGAACLVVFALAALLLLPPAAGLPSGAAADEAPLAPVAEVAELAAVPEPADVQPVLVEPTPISDAPSPEAPLPDVAAEPEILAANIGAPAPLPELRPAAPLPPAANPPAAIIPVKPEKPAPEKPKAGSACVKFGTRIVFLQNPPDAFKKAKEANKQVFFVHLSGNFEDKEFT